MRTMTSGAKGKRPFYSEKDVEQICEDALRSAGYYPDSPKPIKIDRFVERHFRVSPQFEEMPTGVLGYSRFGDRGIISMHISQALVEENSRAAERRVNTTLAHEAGHGLLHAHLFVLSDMDNSLFGHGSEVEGQRVLCRDERETPRKVYDGRWWELQANMAIGPLLVPRRLLGIALQSFLISRGTFGVMEIDPKRREEAIRHTAETFEVNPAVARIRIDRIYTSLGDQLVL